MSEASAIHAEVVVDTALALGGLDLAVPAEFLAKCVGSGFGVVSGGFCASGVGVVSGGFPSSGVGIELGRWIAPTGVDLAGILITGAVAGASGVSGVTGGTGGCGATGVAFLSAGFLSLALMVASVQKPGNFFDAKQGIDVGVVDHLILETLRKALVKGVPEGRITPVGKGCQSVEGQDVCRDLVRVLHAEDADLVLRVSDRIMRTEIYREFLNKHRKISVPRRNSGRVINIRSEPLESYAAEIGDDKEDLIIIRGEVLGAFGKMEVTDGEERDKF